MLCAKEGKDRTVNQVLEGMIYQIEVSRIILNHEKFSLRIGTFLLVVVHFKGFAFMVASIVLLNFNYVCYKDALSFSLKREKKYIYMQVDLRDIIKMYYINRIFSKFGVLFLLFYRQSCGANGIFSRRLDFSAFNSLPRTKLNSYHIKVNN